MNKLMAFVMFFAVLPAQASTDKIKSEVVRPEKTTSALPVSATDDSEKLPQDRQLSPSHERRCPVNCERTTITKQSFKTAILTYPKSSSVLPTSKLTT